MHQHLRDVAAVGLILGLIQENLDGTDDPARRVFGHEHDALAALETGRCFAPERLRFRA